MKSLTYESITNVDELQSCTGKPGKALYRLPHMLASCLILLMVYTIAILAFTLYVLWRCPIHSRWSRVLLIPGWKVDQFYSGLALSVLFTPAALLTRRLANDVALLHPFALAAKMPVSIGDLDLLMHPGIGALGRLFKYSLLRASAQTLLLLVGAFLVPVGTLLVYPGTYSVPRSGTAAVGNPGFASASIMTMSIEMRNSSTYSISDFFLDVVTDIFVGRSISQMGVSQPVPAQLGPVATSNLTYDEGVTYNGIVTYRWTSGCTIAENIEFVEVSDQYEWNFNVTMPDGSQCDNNDAYAPCICVTKDTNSVQNLDTVYYAIMGAESYTVNFDNITSQPDTGLSTGQGAWISRVACTPTLTWEVSSCTYSNRSMTDCVPSPGQNTTQLDIEGLEELYGYMSAIPLNTINMNQYTFGLQTILLPLMFDPQATGLNQYRAPTIEDYDNMYGLIAQSLVTVVTAGYYGVAEVPTTGSAPQPVYLVRLYILFLVAVLLTLCPLAPLIIVLRSVLVKESPLRPTTFLTIANAVRGPWWDRILYGTCLMSPSEARDTLQGLRVMFGVPLEDEHGITKDRHVGFSERVTAVRKDEYYFGVKHQVENRKSSVPLRVSD